MNDSNSILMAQISRADALSISVRDLSVDCLIELPSEFFPTWKNILETLKSMVGIIPLFYIMDDEKKRIITEDYLMEKIASIEEIVDSARKSLEAQDIVQFSDVLELQMIPWITKFSEIPKKLIKYESKSLSN